MFLGCYSLFQATAWSIGCYNWTVIVPLQEMATIHGNFGIALHSTHQDVESGMWLPDSGATDHMTFTATDFTQTSLPQHSNLIDLSLTT